MLIRAKMHAFMLSKVRNSVKAASDLELVLIHDKVKHELQARGILDND